jgi:Rad3-related DNA helicase
LIITHNKGESYLALERFKQSKKPHILVSPVIEEGYDFPDDTCRWQIQYKIPRANSRADPLLKARAKSSKGYLNYLASLRMEQMYGRDKRSPVDWGEGIIFDSLMSRFAKQGTFHNWFKRAWKWIDKLPEPLKLKGV